MFLVRQLYLEQIYGIVVTATLLVHLQAHLSLTVTVPRLIKDSYVALNGGLLIYT